MLAVSLTIVALVLGIYATGVSTAVALVTLYGELFARVDVLGREGFLVSAAGRSPLLVFGQEAVEAIGAEHVRRHVIAAVTIRNRGRRAVQIRLISKFGDDGFFVLDELLPALPTVVEPGHSAELTIGAPPAVPYTHGALGSMRRFFVVDGAGRIHPLRERLRQGPRRMWRKLR